MQASQLRLDDYHLDELRFSLGDNYEFKGTDEERQISAEDLDVEVSPFRNPENPLQWYFRLAVRLDDKEGKFPYSFLIRLTGYFEVTEDCTADMIEPLALINAPSILYASAREILASVSGRSRYLTVLLPSLRFFGPSPTIDAEVVQAPKALSASNATARPKKERKVVRKKK
jgi:preprotein translocase subunit SecB